MNFVTKTLFAAALFSSSVTFAQILKVQPGTEKIEGVALPASASTSEGQKLQFVGAGLRNKKVVMINVKVYIGSLFVTDNTKFKKSEPLKTITDAAPVAMQLHFLRDVDAEKVQTSFKDALEINKVDIKKPEVQKFLDAVKTGGEAKKGSTFTILGSKRSDGSEVIVYEDSNLKATTISGGAGFLQDIFSILFGTPSDDGVAKLKAEILK
ncbi:chalcone isomerase family protein [Bdellovibrio sp. HCB337]|uniref:chalcone isomerase family protein n=1 Tax=Bdellovibrio sp. HCB337 TaxID=3394358 RepID=UPI0039A6ABA4